MNHPCQRASARAKRIHHRERIRARAVRAYAVAYDAPDSVADRGWLQWMTLDGRERQGLPTWEDVHEFRLTKAIRDVRLTRLFAPFCTCYPCVRIPGQSMHERRAAHSAREQLRCLDEAEPA